MEKLYTIKEAKEALINEFKEVILIKIIGVGIIGFSITTTLILKDATSMFFLIPIGLYVVFGSN